MFNSISWEQFLTTAALIIGGYYFITALVFYHREIFAWINTKGKPNIQPPEREQPATNLMGKVQAEPVRPIRKQTVEADQLQFGTTTRDDESEQPIVETKLVNGSVADLLEEIKTLGDMIAENNSPAEEGIPLFKSLLEHYPNVCESPFREAVTIVIHTTCKDTCHYDLTLSEVKSWWASQP